MAKSDLRSAAEMAKKALDLAPGRGDLHALLAEVYLEAQLNASAAAELERARQVGPQTMIAFGKLRRRLTKGST